MPAGSAVLTIEFKINLLKPASGALFRAVGTVVRAGRSVTVCTGELAAVGERGTTTVAVMRATMMTVQTPGLAG